MELDLRSEKLRRFLTDGRPKLLRLAVVRPGRKPSPHVSSVWYLWRNGCFWISTTKDRLKVAAIRKNNRVALIVDTDIMPYQGVIVEGIATLTERNLEEITMAIVGKYMPPKDVRAEFDDLMRYPRVLIRVKPVKAIDIMSYRTV